MSIWKKLFGSSSSSNKKKVYKSSDNVGTTYTDYKNVNAAWQAQGMSFGKGSTVNLMISDTISKDITTKGSPYICYTYTNENDAKKGLSSISFIKIASDTREFISLETLEFGCYETETEGTWEVIIWGEDFTKEMFEEASSKLSAAGGKKKGERKPQKIAVEKPKTSQQGGKVSYVRTDVQGSNTYEIHKAPSKHAAMEFLKKKTVTKPLYYVIVETPEGNWGRDIDGIYQE